MLFQARKGRDISFPFSSLSHCHQQENHISSEHALAPTGFNENDWLLTKNICPCFLQ